MTLPAQSPPPSVLPDISPSRGEIASRRLLASFSTLRARRGACRLPISPLEGEMSGRTEGGKHRSTTSIRKPLQVRQQYHALLFIGVGAGDHRRGGLRLRAIDRQ